MDFILPFLSALAGLAIGGAAAWATMRPRAQREYTRGKTAGDADRAALTERVSAQMRTIEDKDNAIRRLEEAAREAQVREVELSANAGRLDATLRETRRQADEKLAVIHEAQQKLSDAFKALASEALKSNNQSFIELAKATLETFQQAAKGDLEKRQQAIGELVKPVRESLDKVDVKINELEKARAGAYEGLTSQVKSLRETQVQLQSETSNLVRALRAPQVRGRWGEIQLKRVVEMAGMLDHCDFYEQQTADSGEGRLRPDLLVRLPGRKNVVVDSKTPLMAYLEAIEAPDDATRKARLQDHARQVRAHITALSKKSYFEQFDPAPEFVVLFLPGEAFFAAAVEQDPALIEFGVDQNVIIATPTTLIALLRAVAYGWRQEQLATSAKEISDLGRELYKRLSDLGGHVARLGKALQQATEAYNKAVGSLELRVLSSARKFKDLGIGTSDTELDALPTVDALPRALQSAEMLVAVEDCKLKIEN